MMQKKRYLNLGVCPSCASGRVAVRNTEKPYRKIQCLVCKKCWRTVEVIMAEKDWLHEFIRHLLISGKLENYVGLPHLLENLPHLYARPIDDDRP